jgi:hypothetical protein
MVFFGSDQVDAINATTSTPPPSRLTPHPARMVWAPHWNNNPQPFAWTNTVDDVIINATRGWATLDRVSDAATDHEPDPIR